MEGIDVWSLSAGIFLSLLGLFLFGVSFKFPIALFYAVPCFIIGVVILFTLKKQEYIEPIKEKVKRGRK